MQNEKTAKTDTTATTSVVIEMFEVDAEFKVPWGFGVGIVPGCSGSRNGGKDEDDSVTVVVVHQWTILISYLTLNTIRYVYDMWLGYTKHNPIKKLQIQDIYIYNLVCYKLDTQIYLKLPTKYQR